MYNTGPFDSDTAQDLLELFAELTIEERLANLRMVFLGGQPRHPDGPVEPVDQTEVIAGAALIALALPGGVRVNEIPQMDFDEQIAAAAITNPETDLVQLALDAIRKVETDDEWLSRWLSSADSTDSHNTIAAIISVLAGHVAAPS